MGDILLLPGEGPPELDQKLAGEVKSRFGKWRSERQVHERMWFIVSAFRRGSQYLEWTAPEQAKPNAKRVRLTINRFQQKLRARFAKLTKNRPRPVVIPATSEYQDYQNAKASQKALDYLWRKLSLEEAYQDVLLWAEVCGKGFWWFHWDPDATGRVAIKDPTTGATTYEDRPMGQPMIEVGSPFEVFVKDPGCRHIGDQTEIIRAKMRPLDEMKQRYPGFAADIEQGGRSEQAFQFERRIATLASLVSGPGTDKKRDDHVLVLEWFVRPSPEWPKGRYVVVVGEVVVKDEPELPFFSDMARPFPVVEFADQLVAGQFWPPTLAEQLIDVQREYNLLRSKLSEHLRLMALPKLLVATQHGLAKGAWTADAGEIVEFAAHPQIPPPQPWFPPNVAGDLWKAIELIQKEFDDITAIHPTAEGQLGGATSGFQTNLLQEASDSIHQPEIRGHELSMEEAATKLRRMIKLGWDVPRLLSIAGANYEPDVFEFSASQIDEAADVQVQIGSALPLLKAARQDMVLQLFREGLLGDVTQPAVKQRALSLLEMGSLEEAYDFAKTHENKARLENKEIGEGRPVPNPEFCDNHQLHYDFHAAELVALGKDWPLPKKAALIAHMLLHGRYIDPVAALQVAMDYQLSDVVAYLQPIVAAMMPPPPVAGPEPGPSTPPPPPGPQG